MRRLPLALLLFCSLSHADETLPTDAANSTRTVILLVRGSALYALTCSDKDQLFSGGHCRDMIPAHAEIRLSDGSVTTIEPGHIGCGHAEQDPALGFRFSDDQPRSAATWAIWSASATNVTPISDGRKYLATLAAKKFVQQRGLPVAELHLAGRDQRQLLIERFRHGKPDAWSVAIGPIWKPIAGPPPMIYGSFSCD
jgi:hypothetical protein